MKKILVIDDDRHISTLIKFILEKEGFNVFVASSGEEALSLQSTEEFNLIISDLVMPGMDGIEILQTIKRNCASKFMAISGYHFSYLETAKLLGADHTLIKPFNRSELLEAVNTLL